MLQVNISPHQLIVKEERHGEYEKALSVILSLIINTSHAMIWKVLPKYMSFMEFLAKRWKCKEDVFYVTFMPPWRHLICQANDIKEALIGRQPNFSFSFLIIIFCFLLHIVRIDLFVIAWMNHQHVLHFDMGLIKLLWSCGWKNNLENFQPSTCLARPVC